MRVDGTRDELEILATAMISMKWRIEAEKDWQQIDRIATCNNWIKAISEGINRDSNDSPLNKTLHEN